MKFLANTILHFLGADVVTDSAVDPIFDFLEVFGPAMMGILGLVGVIYCIVLGVQYSKAETADERGVAKSKMTNAIIGFVVIIGLIALLYELRVPIVEALV